MKGGTCPNCGASSFFTRQAGVSRGDGRVHMYIGGVTKPTKFDDSVCTSCSCLGSSIPDAEKRLAIEMAWSKVG